MVLQNYQKLKENTSNMIYIVALGVGFKCPHKIHLNTQCSGGGVTNVRSKSRGKGAISNTWSIDRPDFASTSAETWMGGA